MNIEIIEVPVGAAHVRVLMDLWVDLPTVESAAAAFPGTRTGGWDEWLADEAAQANATAQRAEGHWATLCMDGIQPGDPRYPVPGIESCFEGGSDGQWLDVEEAQQMACWYSAAFGQAFNEALAPVCPVLGDFAL